MFTVGGKCLRKPDIGKIQKAYRITKPLVGKLVGDHQLLRASAGDDVISQGGHSLVFHGSKSAHIYRGITIFFKGIIPKKTRVIVYHIRQRGQIV